MLCLPLPQRGVALGELAQQAGEFTCTNLGHPRLSAELLGCLIPLLGRDPGAAGSCWLHRGPGERMQDISVSPSELRCPPQANLLLLAAHCFVFGRA